MKSAIVAVLVSLAALSANAQSYTVEFGDHVGTNNNTVTLPMYIDWNKITSDKTNAPAVPTNIIYSMPTNRYIVTATNLAFPSSSTISNWARAGVLCAALGHAWQETMPFIDCTLVYDPNGTRTRAIGQRRCFLCGKQEYLYESRTKEWK